MDFEKQYIFEKCVNDNSDAVRLFKFLYQQEFHKSPYYSFALYIEFLMNISDFELLKSILFEFRQRKEELVNILKKLVDQNVADNYYKFLIVWSSFFHNHYVFRDYLRKYDKIETALNEMESATVCTELKREIGNLRKNILFSYPNLGEILDDIL